MSYCPRCRYEYEGGVLTCPDCGEALRAGPPLEESKPKLQTTAEKLVPVLTPENEAQAVMVRDLLRANDLPATAGSQEMPWYDGLASRTMNMGRWGQVLVRESDYPAARELLADFFAAVDEAPAEDTESEAD